MEADWKPNPRESKVHAVHGVLAFLEARGIDVVFGVPGGTVSPFFDALHESGISLITNQQETMAVYMASGWARATGRPGVVWVTSGPGILSAVTGIAAALQDEIPLIVICGDVSRDQAGRGVLQDGGPDGLNVVEVCRPVVKSVRRLSVETQLQAAVVHAHATATAHPRGPCVLSVPVDVGRSPRGGRVVHRGLQLPACPESTTEAILDEWSRARRPAIVAGVGAARAGVGSDLQRLAERTRTPVFLDLEARGLVDERSGIFGGCLGGGSPIPAYLQAGVDFLLTVGARLDDTSTGNHDPVFRPEGATVVQLDHDERRLCRSYDPDIAVCCDLATAVRTLRVQMGHPPVDVLLSRGVATRDPRPTLDLPAHTEGTPFHPSAVVAEIGRAFPDAAVVSDIGNHLLSAAQGLSPSDPLGLTVANGLGGMGSGIGTAAGLATTLRERRVVCICGDGGMLMHGSELATCVRHRLPVTFVLFDDQQLGMVEHGMEALYGRSGCGTLPTVDWSAWGRALGLHTVPVGRLADLRVFDPDGPTLLVVPIQRDARVANSRVGAMGTAS